jgi:hypothetical protein
LIEVHYRLTNAYQSKSTKTQHLKPWEQTMQDNAHYLELAAKLGPSVHEMVAVIIASGQGFIDTRRVWGILSLDKTYAPHQINAACKQALELKCHSYQTVKTFLKLGAGKAQEQAPTREDVSSHPATKQDREKDKKK